MVTYIPGMQVGLDAVFAALADPTRREILASLQRDNAPVHALARHFAISRPAVSKHLAVLRTAGLVREQRRGRENIYTLDIRALEQARTWLGAFWRGKLGALKRLAEDDHV